MMPSVKAEPPAEHPAEVVMKKMVEELDRPGKLQGKGFYEYPEKGKKHLWSGLADAFGGSKDMPFEDIKERMMFIESLEAVKCFDEGVMDSVADANIGSIFGIGFPAWTGGVMQYINQYEGGLRGFVARAQSWPSFTVSASTRRPRWWKKRKKAKSTSNP